MTEGVVWHVFIHIPHIYIHELPAKYPWEKISDPKYHRKKLGFTNYPRQKILNPRNTHKKWRWTHEGTVARWHETCKTHDGMRNTEFSTLTHKPSKLPTATKKIFSSVCLNGTTCFNKCFHVINGAQFFFKVSCEGFSLTIF